MMCFMYLCFVPSVRLPRTELCSSRAGRNRRHGGQSIRIKEIVHSRLNSWTGRLEYLVEWLGYEGTDEYATWNLAADVTGANELLQQFHLRNPKKPSKSKEVQKKGGRHLCSNIHRSRSPAPTTPSLRHIVNVVQEERKILPQLPREYPTPSN